MPNFKKHKKHVHKVLGLGALVLIFVFYISFFHSASSSALDNVSGYAWSGDWSDNYSDPDAIPPIVANNGVQNLPYEETGGLGWLSFNCKDGGDGGTSTCGNIDYGIDMDSAGNLTGYAWSGNKDQYGNLSGFGWLKFGGLSGFPSGSGTSGTNAKVDLNTGAVTGWARFCSAAASPDTCNGFVSNPSNGGWDGWVSLSGSSPSYGVSLSLATNQFSGYAWGGNNDAGGNNRLGTGWISFNCANVGGGGCGPSNYKVIYAPVTAPTVTLQASPIAVPSGGTTTLSWDGLNLAGGNTCVGSNPTGPAVAGWIGAHPSPSGTFVTPALSNGTYNFTIVCNGSPSGSATSSVTVTVGIQLNFYAQPASASVPDYQTTLHWNSIPAGANLTNCLLSSTSVGTNIPVASFTMPPGGSAPNINVPDNPTEFKLSCFDGINTITKEIFVPRIPPIESVTLTSNGVVLGATPPHPAGTYITTLSWSTVNVAPNSCVASSSAGPSTNWSGSRIDNGQQPPNPNSDVIVPTIPPPPATTTYKLTCTGKYSGNSFFAEIKLNQDSGVTSNKKQPKYKEN